MRLLASLTNKNLATFIPENEKNTRVDQFWSLLIPIENSLLKSRRMSQLIDDLDMHIHNILVTFDLACDGHAIIHY